MRADRTIRSSRSKRAREKKKREGDEDALKTELARNEIIILRWIERERSSISSSVHGDVGERRDYGMGVGDREVIRTGGG